MMKRSSFLPVFVHFYLSLMLWSTNPTLLSSFPKNYWISSNSFYLFHRRTMSICWTPPCALQLASCAPFWSWTKLKPESSSRTCWNLWCLPVSAAIISPIQRHFNSSLFFFWIDKQRTPMKSRLQNRRPSTNWNWRNSRKRNKFKYLRQNRWPILIHTVFCFVCFPLKNRRHSVKKKRIFSLFFWLNSSFYLFCNNTCGLKTRYTVKWFAMSWHWSVETTQTNIIFYSWCYSSRHDFFVFPFQLFFSSTTKTHAVFSCRSRFIP